MTGRPAAAHVIIAACLSACCSSLGCKKTEPEPAGPTLADVGSDKGVLTLRFAKSLPGARVQVREETRSGLPDGFRTELGAFPVRISVPIKAILIKATAPDYSPFEKRVVFTSQEREREVIIALPDEPDPDRFGVRMADLPAETGFLPLALPEAGKPAALIFEHLTGGHDWARGDWSSERLVVDENADVWRGRCSRDAPDPVYVRIGRIESRAFASARALRSQSVQGSLDQIPGCWGCFDCSNSALRIHLDGSPEGVVIAEGAGQCAMRPGARSLVAWLVALDRAAPVSKYLPAWR